MKKSAINKVRPGNPVNIKKAMQSKKSPPSNSHTKPQEQPTTDTKSNQSIASPIRGQGDNKQSLSTKASKPKAHRFVPSMAMNRLAALEAGKRTSECINYYIDDIYI